MEMAERRDIYLNSSERYEIWCIKAAERPEILCATESEGLVDGCDIPSWRSHGFVESDGCAITGARSSAEDEGDMQQEIQSLLQVGQGCPMTRRESQLPLVGTRHRKKWEELKNELLKEPLVDSKDPGLVAKRIEYIECMQLHPWFERENVPVVIDGCTEKWAAMQSCRFENLVNDYGHLEWRFSDTHAETMTLQTYRKYINSIDCATDDAPLAVYDSQYSHDERARLLDDYSVPKCFDSDLFDTIDGNFRPPFQWILIGPERSGTGLHIDPVGTHAWVTLIEGAKRWLLFPPDVPHELIGMQSPQIPSSIWFANWYHRVKHLGVEVLQKPGETVYVPAGWPHLVLNLELSVALTHNYASQYPSLENLWNEIHAVEPELAGRLRRDFFETKSLSDRKLAVLG